jgi:hypothetical protein
VDPEALEQLKARARQAVERSRAQIARSRELIDAGRKIADQIDRPESSRGSRDQ